MKKRKIKHQKKRGNNESAFVDDIYEWVYEYYPNSLRRRFVLKLKSLDSPPLKAFLDGLKFKKD